MKIVCKSLWGYKIIQSNDGFYILKKEDPSTMYARNYVHKFISLEESRSWINQKHSWFKKRSH